MINHFSNSWGGQNLIILLKYFQASSNNSLSFCEKIIISFVHWTILDERKYLARKTRFNSSQVFEEWTFIEYSQNLPSYFSGKGKSLTLMTSLETSSIFMRSQHSRKMDRWWFISSICKPENWHWYDIKDNKSGSISKLLAYIVEHTILEYGYVALGEA